MSSIRLDLVGKKFGHLTVLEQKGKNKAGSYLYLCQCSCGKKKVILGTCIKSGHTKSCGCSHGLSPQEYVKSKIKIDENGCWIWGASKRRRGYGHAHYNGKEMPAHVLSYIAFKSDVPKGLCVCHKCDVTSCVNPDHLFISTCAGNSADMVRKKRSLHGVKNHKAKLTEENVRVIRKEYNPEKRNGNILAKRFNVDKAQIYCIIHRKTWRHVN